MAKYIFYMLLGLFLILKVVSASDDIKEYKVSHTIDIRHVSGNQHGLFELDLDRHETGIWCGSYNDRTARVCIGNNFSFRCISPSKILRDNTALIIARMVKSLKVLLPEEKTISFSFSIRPFNFSYRYYVYTLRRILI